MTITSVLKTLSVATTAAIAIAFSVGEAAQAVFFDFTRPGEPVNFLSELTFSSPTGITVTATGATLGGNSRNINQSQFGLGVGNLSPIEVNGSLGIANDEILRLDFDSSKIKVNEVLFSLVSGDDNASFRLDEDNSKVLLEQLLDTSGIFSFSGTALENIFANVVEIGALEPTDSFFVAGIDVSPIPEPFTIFGSLSALGVGTLMKKQHDKRQKKVKSDA
ncbi:PEP-CTERM sorting domain-containing protein [Capilliphycus salinus ALCB114379]|uniref:PEP-CTERM sorting domain-containing protein n=1 Tax=Capilliphycus salinus TaxID=2768948 RepID=UPI0039A680BD